MGDSRTVVLVDMDGVLVQLIPHILNYINQDWGTFYEEEDLTSFYLEENINLPDRVIYRYFCEHGTFGPERKPYSGAVHAMQRLVANEKVWPLICTSPMLGHANCEREKREWVAKHLPFFPQKDIIFTSHKFLIDGDMLIDDKPANVEAFADAGGRSIVVDRPWNQDVKETRSISRCRSWVEIEKTIGVFLEVNHGRRH